MDFPLRIVRAARTSATAILRRFGRAREGATALEFAIVATPFFLFLMATMEIAYMFFLSVMVDNATLSSARLIRTGEAQIGEMTAQDFWDEVCSRISVIAPCSGHLYLDVQTYNAFDATRSPPPITSGDFDNANLQMDFGQEGDIVLVRAFYIWDVIFPDLGTGLANLNDGKRLLISTVAFRNEPYGED